MIIQLRRTTYIGLRMPSKGIRCLTEKTENRFYLLQKKSIVAQVIGTVVDVVFDTTSAALPKIYDSLEITKADGSKLVLEVQSHIGENTVRTISMDSTDGLSRGIEVIALGTPIQMPVGKEVDRKSVV